MTARVRPISERRFLVGESPLWDPRRRQALFVDIRAGSLHAYDPSTGDIVDHAFGEPLGFVALAGAGALALGLKSGLRIYDPDRRVFLGAPLFTPAPEERINDGTVAPDGTLWFGTMRVPSQPGRGRLWRLVSGRSAVEIADGFTVPNGPAFDGAGRAYHADTPLGVIERFTLLGNGWRREPFLSLPEVGGRPDGLAVDDEDTLWCGAWGGGRLIQAPIASPERYRSLDLPATWVTAVAPIGERGEFALVTTASFPMPDSGGPREDEGRTLLLELERPWRPSTSQYG